MEQFSDRYWCIDSGNDWLPEEIPIFLSILAGAIQQTRNEIDTSFYGCP